MRAACCWSRSLWYFCDAVGCTTVVNFARNRRAADMLTSYRGMYSWLHVLQLGSCNGYTAGCIPPKTRGIRAAMGGGCVLGPLNLLLASFFLWEAQMCVR